MGNAFYADEIKGLEASTARNNLCCEDINLVKASLQYWALQRRAMTMPHVIICNNLPLPLEYLSFQEIHGYFYTNIMKAFNFQSDTPNGRMTNYCIPTGHSGGMLLCNKDFPSIERDVSGYIAIRINTLYMAYTILLGIHAPSPSLSSYQSKTSIGVEILSDILAGQNNETNKEYYLSPAPIPTLKKKEFTQQIKHSRYSDSNEDLHLFHTTHFRLEVRFTNQYDENGPYFLFSFYQPGISNNMT
eukprot:gene693-748_t